MSDGDLWTLREYTNVKIPFDCFSFLFLLCSSVLVDEFLALAVYPAAWQGEKIATAEHSSLEQISLFTKNRFEHRKSSLGMRHRPGLQEWQSLVTTAHALAFHSTVFFDF